MRKVVCLNRACQPPEAIQANLLAGLSEPWLAVLRLRCLLPWKRGVVLHLFYLEKIIYIHHTKNQLFIQVRAQFPRAEPTGFSPVKGSSLLKKISTISVFFFLNLRLRP